MTDKQVLRNFVNGSYMEPVAGGYADLFDPSTGEVYASAPVSGPEDVNAAMAAAAAAFETWRDTGRAPARAVEDR
jgi:betaine-aldehyde dehydrogenase